MFDNHILDTIDVDDILIQGQSHKGIFKSIEALLPQGMGLSTWMADKVVSLDWDYYLNHSGSKYASPMVERMLSAGVTKDQILAHVAAVAVDKYLIQWNKVYETMTALYNPIENYSMKEKSTYNSKVEHSGSEDTIYQSSIDHTGSDTQNYDSKTEYNTDNDFTEGSRSTESEANAIQQDNVYAFDTTDTSPSAGVTITGPTASGAFTDSITDSYGVPKSNQVGGNKAKQTTTQSTADNEKKDEETIRSGKDELEYDSSQEHNGNDTLIRDLEDAHTGYDELERSGNIGVTTSQQMMQSEFDLRQVNQLIDLMYKTIDSVYCMSTY